MPPDRCYKLCARSIYISGGEGKPPLFFDEIVDALHCKERLQKRSVLKVEKTLKGRHRAGSIHFQNS